MCIFWSVLLATLLLKHTHTPKNTGRTATGGRTAQVPNPLNHQGLTLAPCLAATHRIACQHAASNTHLASLTIVETLRLNSSSSSESILNFMASDHIFLSAKRGTDVKPLSKRSTWRGKGETILCITRVMVQSALHFRRTFRERVGQPSIVVVGLCINSICCWRGLMIAAWMVTEQRSPVVGGVMCSGSTNKNPCCRAYVFDAD